MKKIQKKKKTKVWAVTYADGYEFSGVVYEIYDNKKSADDRATKLNAVKQCQSPGAMDEFEVEEFTLNGKSKYLW